jgi:hypothetical protein
MKNGKGFSYDGLLVLLWIIFFPFMVIAAILKKTK